jgi:hypothetical protein
MGFISTGAASSSSFLPAEAIRNCSLTGKLERSPASLFAPGYEGTPVGGFSSVPEKWNDNAQIQKKKKNK